MYIARHVIGCHLTQETRARNALHDMAGSIHQCLPLDALPRAGAGHGAPPPGRAAPPAAPPVPLHVERRRLLPVEHDLQAMDGAVRPPAPAPAAAAAPQGRTLIHLSA